MLGGRGGPGLTPPSGEEGCERVEAWPESCAEAGGLWENSLLAVVEARESFWMVVVVTESLWLVVAGSGDGSSSAAEVWAAEACFWLERAWWES